MSVLSDKTIEALCTPPFHYDHIVERYLHGEGMESVKVDPGRSIDNNGKPMIEPFVPHQISKEGDQKILSYGTSSYGYDVRLDRNFKIFSNAKNALLDPLNPTDDCYIDHEGDYCIIPPNSYILGHTIERFDIPRNVMTVAVGKSTLARLGGIVNVTPIEPGFRGTVVVEIANCTTLPLKVYANQGIAQFMFFIGDQPCKTSYADKQGKYQNQSGLTTARL